MKLNKKGFTLVELLAVIVLLAILIGVGATAIINTMNSAKAKTFKTTFMDIRKEVQNRALIGEGTIACANAADCATLYDLIVSDYTLTVKVDTTGSYTIDLKPNPTGAFKSIDLGSGACKGVEKATCTTSSTAIKITGKVNVDGTIVTP